MAIEDEQSYNSYLAQLEEAADVTITGYGDLLEALRRRHDFFHENGCRISDHGLEYPCCQKFTQLEVERIFDAVRRRKTVDKEDILKFKTAILLELARMDAEKKWVQQFHFGALRNTNAAALKKLGPDTGYDSIGDFEMGRELAAFFNILSAEGSLAKTILYNLNPSDNELFATRRTAWNAR